MEKPGIGIVGCGAISNIYFKNLCNVLNDVQVVACADLDTDRMETKAAEFPGVVAQSTQDLMRNDKVDVVLNLTTPQAHFSVASQALDSGKHVYNEKPLTLTREEARELLQKANDNNLRIGCAPDTFMGAGIQTCRRIIDNGDIGEPLGAQAFMLCPGHESWHPDPEFYYQIGGGPMFDMGPYYLTAMTALLGPVKKVTGATRITSPTRTITSDKKYGKQIEVEVPTHVTGLLNFENGPIGTITTSFDVIAAEVPRIEIFGTKGSLSVPDPNNFGGPVRMKGADDDEWREISLIDGFAENSRGIGVTDMAAAVADNRPHCASGDLGYHVLDIMHSIHDAANQEQHQNLNSGCERPVAFDSNKFC